MQLFVRTSAGKRTPLEVEPDTDVAEVKKKIEEKEGIPVNLQKMEILVKTLRGTTFTIEVEQNNDIRMVKTKIEEQTAIPVSEQRLFFAGQDLSDDRSLAEYRIPNKATMHMIQRLRGCGGGRPTKVTVPLPYDGKYEAMPCCGTTVLDFKEEMDKKAGIRASRIKLFYNGKELEDVKHILFCIPHDPEVELSLELVD